MKPVALARATTLAALAALVFTAGCASAGKRLEQGGDAEAQGDYIEAAGRYLDALEKDGSLVEAREALRAVWDSVTVPALVRAQMLAGRSPVAAGEEFLMVDRFLARSDAVRAPLPEPVGYRDARRRAFDGAIASLMEEGHALAEEARWGQARGRYQRVGAFDPSGEQARDADIAEADALLDWSGAEALDGRFQASYNRAREALEVSNRLPSELADAAQDLQHRALAQGLRVLAVFPLEETSESVTRELPEFAAALTDVLDVEHWRRPPYFVAVADPAGVRRATRRLAPPGVPLRPGRILDAVGADFGALIQVVDVEVEDRDVRSREVQGRTRDGRRATYRVESGQRRYTVTVEVTLFQEDGREVDSFTTRTTRSGRFERGVYGGDPGNLELTRGERRLFDDRQLRVQRGETVGELVGEAAKDVAGNVYDRVVQRIP